MGPELRRILDKVLPQDLFPPDVKDYRQVPGGPLRLAFGLLDPLDATKIGCFTPSFRARVFSGAERFTLMC